QEDMTVGDVLKTHKVLPYSRIPLYTETCDDIKTFVLRGDLLMAAAQDQDEKPIRELARPLDSVPENMTVDAVLAAFTNRQQHMFLVFDEYGGTSGIITMEDAIESLIGVEITDESDLVADLRQLARQRYQRQLKLLGIITDPQEISTSPPQAGESQQSRP